MILLTLSRGKGEETVRLQLPASPAEIGETFAFLDRISLDTTATAILDVSSNVPVLYRCLYDVDVEDSEQFQKLQKLAERTEALSPAKAAIFSGALDAECVWNLEGALTVADRLDEYMLVNNVSSDVACHISTSQRTKNSVPTPLTWWSSCAGRERNSSPPARTNASPQITVLLCMGMSGMIMLQKGVAMQSPLSKISTA